MTIKEKIELSKQNFCFTLHAEGIFYKCYNEDAMVFSKFVKPYKINSKYIKSINETVLSLGFPISEIKNGNLSFNNISSLINAESFIENEITITFKLNENIKQNFNNFKTSLETCRDIACNVSATVETKIIKLISEYDLANSTPMNALIFIQQLKEEIK